MSMSQQPDGFGYYYGFTDGDHRQINVRFEGDRLWVAYTRGEEVGSHFTSNEQAWEAAESWLKENPDE